ncbi:MAG: efflux RND transporter permease subunit [Alphaproteobacteria bacterium]|nr:efflux RND transporter permease subunit [Alphaproteobacteria bacterium]MCB9699735.1 efflux RND transporter permease subunit [Alphaproteobacteria bacterium]
MNLDPAGFSVRQWQFTSIVLLLLVALGIVTWRTIPRAEDPPFDAPNFLVVAVLPGAGPADVEARVLDPIEDRLGRLDDLDVYAGTASDGVATLDVRYVLDGTDPDDRYAELLRELDAAREDLPEELDRLEVLELRPDAVSALVLALVAPTASVDELRTATEALEEAIERVPGVRDAAVRGLPDERVDVSVDAEALAASGVPVDAVLGALDASTARIPGGHVTVGSRRFSVSTRSDWRTEQDLRDTVIATVEGVPLRVGDVATVQRRAAEAEHLTRFDGQRAVWIPVTFTAGGQVFETRDAVMDAVRAVPLPEGAHLELPFDQSTQVAHRMSGFTRDFALAIGLVLLTLLPLGWRASGVVMVAIPLSLSMGLTALHWLGFSINQLSVVGFVIALGLLVDDAIVVVENVARHLRQGKDPVTAAIDGTREITLAVIGCTATLLLAFLPLLALPGTAGLFIRSLPVTVVVTIAASLVLSLTVVPLLASRWLRPEPEHGNRVFRALEWAIERSFRPVLGVAVRRPWLTMGASAALVAGSLALVPAVGFSLFPKSGAPMFRITVDAGEGASLEATDALAHRVEEELGSLEGVRHVLTNVGHGNPRVYYNVGEEATRAGFAELLVLVEQEAAHDLPAQLDELRGRLNLVPGADIAVREFEQGPPVDAPVAIRLVGDDLDALREGSAAIAASVGAVDGLVRVDDPLAVRRTDLVVDVDRGAAGQLGVAPAEVARVVRFGLAGLELGEMRDDDGDTTPVVVQLSENGATRSVGDLSRLAVARAGGGTLPLGEIANIRMESGPPRIHHRDGQRVAVVTADVRTGENTAKLTSAALEHVATTALPEGVRWEVAGEAESRSESFDGIGSAALVAAFGVLAVLVLEFRTFRSTLVVASVVPLGVAGGIAALWLTGNTLSFTASIGFVALMGIEVKNSILLVDFANQLRRQGVPMVQAISRAGETRFVPILLTTATALGGLVPLALEGSALYSPLAIVLIGGLMSSTLLARVVTPVVYTLLAPPVPADELEAGALPVPA